MNVLIIGSSSKVSVELSEILISEGHRCTLAGREGPDIIFDSSNLAPEAISSLLVHDYDFYVINSGLLTAQNFLTQPKIQLLNSVTINLLAPVYIAESILTKNGRCKSTLLLALSLVEKEVYDITYFLLQSSNSSICQAEIPERAKYSNFFSSLLQLLRTQGCRQDEAIPSELLNIGKCTPRSVYWKAERWLPFYANSCPRISLTFRMLRSRLTVGNLRECECLIEVK